LSDEYVEYVKGVRLKQLKKSCKYIFVKNAFNQNDIISKIINF